MIRITSIEIDGFILENQKVKLDFVDSNIVCIYGDNGSGKTTFLEVLFAVFDRRDKDLEKYQVQKVKIDYLEDKSDIKRQINERKEELKYCEDEEERDRLESEIRELEKDIIPESVKVWLDINDNNKEFYNFEELDNFPFSNISSLFLGIGRGIHKKEFNIKRSKFINFFNANRKISENVILTDNEIDKLSEKLFQWLIPKDKSKINRIDNMDMESIVNKKNINFPYIEIDTLIELLYNRYKSAVLNAKEKIKNALSATSIDFLKSFEIKNNLDLDRLQKKLLYNKSLILEIFPDEKEGLAFILKKIEQDNSFLEKLDISQQIILENMVNQLENEIELFKKIQIFVNEYNKFLNYNKKLVLSSDGVYIAPKNHSLQKLSSGERHMLTFLATILLLGESKDFILIDEPEISLNVDWQRNILATIAKLAPNSQVIVATHSPLVARNYRKSVVGIEPKVKDE